MSTTDTTREERLESALKVLLLVRAVANEQEGDERLIVAYFNGPAWDEAEQALAQGRWPHLAQPFTNNLMDEILRNMSDEDLDELLARSKDNSKPVSGVAALLKENAKLRTDIAQLEEHLNAILFGEQDA